MGRLRVYISPFDTTGNYTAYTEVTEDVVTTDLKVKRKIDSSDFNVGIFKYNSIPLLLDNTAALFSDVDNIRSMFSYKRANSKVKLTWDMATEGYQCGLSCPDSDIIGEEVTVFEGLLSDEGSKTDIRQQNIDFKILGFESICAG